MENEEVTTEPTEAAPAEAAKPPRKKRAPRKKKAAAEALSEAAVEPASAEPEAAVFHQAVNTVIADAQARREGEHKAEPQHHQAEAPVHAEQGKHVKALQGAKPRKSGRRAWDINLRGDGHTWERVETPANADAPSQLVFRFKDEPSGAQMDLIQKFGFAFDPDHKEAYRENDIAGRTYADKLSWYLKGLERQPAAQGVAV